VNIQLPDTTQFNIKDCVVAGDTCVLITPKSMDVDWNNSNKMFRSSIWTKQDMRPVSLSFKKFTNWGERPDFEPWTPQCDPHTAVVKVDGSTLIISKHQGEIVVRTRGTVDASVLPNGHEINILREKYPKVFNNTMLDQENMSFLYEWTTPSNRIVLRETTSPCLTLIGVVNHHTYTYVPQLTLDLMAVDLDVPRPSMICFNNIDVLQEFVERQTDIEGVVMYSADGQTLKKIKTARYLRLHRVFTGIKTVDHLFDLWMEHDCVDRSMFEQELTMVYDWELVESLKMLLDDLFNKWHNITSLLSTMRSYINNPDFMTLTRREQAKLILEKFSDDAGVVFSLLDNKKICPRKLWQWKFKETC
jgi:RNA ligase